MHHALVLLPMAIVGELVSPWVFMSTVEIGSDIDRPGVERLLLMKGPE